jgi:hypothetical protein
VIVPQQPTQNLEAFGLVLAAEAIVAVSETQEDRTGLCQARTFIF